MAVGILGDLRNESKYDTPSLTLDSSFSIVAAIYHMTR